MNEDFKALFRRWLDKAKSYDYNADNTEEILDKFFSFYVLYNALYVETTLHLNRRAERLGRNEYNLQNGDFPDRNAATKYVLQFMTSRSLMESLIADQSTKQAIEQIDQLIDIDEQGFKGFWICLNPVSGDPRYSDNPPNPDEPRYSEDRELIMKLKSSATDMRAGGILQLIYEVRNNLFHGRKNINSKQKELLIPLIVLLEKITEKLFRKLDNNL